MTREETEEHSAPLMIRPVSSQALTVSAACCTPDMCLHNGNSDRPVLIHHLQLERGVTPLRTRDIERERLVESRLQRLWHHFGLAVLCWESMVHLLRSHAGLSISFVLPPAAVQR